MRSVAIYEASVAQLVARKSHNLKVPGSIPGGGSFVANHTGLYILPDALS